jgi:uncharacterized membrane protein YcaP (DUF421 family)
MDYAAPLLRACLAVALIVALTRLVGLRSFSKMTGFDFVSTVAIGSLLAAAVTAEGRDHVIALLALGAVFAVKWGLGRARRADGRARALVDNAPLLLMEEGRFDDPALRRAGVTRDDVYAKLREANALDLARVHAVVLETTGDISVLHGATDSPLSPEILSGVRRAG